MKSKVVFVADKNGQNCVHKYFLSEYQAFCNTGINSGISIEDDDEVLFYRGFMAQRKEDYPSDPRFINGWNIYQNTLLLSKYNHLITDLSIPTFFVEKLDESIIHKIEEKGWSKVFIKNDIKSLWTIDELASVWPEHSFNEILSDFNRCFPYYNGMYAIRQFVDPKLFYNEERYWVLNNKIYHRSGIIPDIVKKAAKRLSVIGSAYYVIDAIPDYIVEINPGESSDRGGYNTPELFAEWWKEAFSLGI